MIQILTSETYVEMQLMWTRNQEQKCAQVSPIMDTVQLLTHVNCPMTLILLYLRKLQNRIKSGGNGKIVIMKTTVETKCQKLIKLWPVMVKVKVVVKRVP